MRWIGSHRKTAVVAAVMATAFMVVNALAYRHARAMTHFVPAGNRTARPEQLSILQKVGVLVSGVSIPKPSAGRRTPADVGLPFKTYRLPGPAGVELEAWHVPHADGRALVVMFHGYAACKADLLGEAKALHDLGYAILLVDFRGSGGSSGRDTTIGALEAEDVSLAADFARRHWGELPQVLYGQSMGSAAILRAIGVEGENPAAVVLECPFDRLLTTVGNRFAAMGLPPFPGAHLLIFWGGVQQGFNGFRHNPVEYAKRVTCPVLHLHGADDPRVSLQEADAVFKAFVGEKQLEIFPGVRHTPYYENVPDRWRQVVGDFLAAHSRGKQ